MTVKPHYLSEPHILGWLQAFSLPSDIVLDVGSGDRRYHDIPVKEIVTVDCWPLAEPDYLIDLDTADLPQGEFGVILLIDILEHLSKERGLEILRQAQALASRAVVVLTPLKWEENRDAYEDPQGFYFGNEHILHSSLWTLDDFGKDWVRVWLPSTQDCFMGYRVKR